MRRSVNSSAFYAVWMTAFCAVAGCSDMNITINGKTYTNGYSFTRTGESVERKSDNQLRSDVRTIEVENQFGDVLVEPANTGDESWSWNVKTWAQTTQTAQSWCNAIKMDVQSNGDTETWKLVIPTENKSELQGLKSDLVLRVPKSTIVSVRNSHGDSVVQQIDGTVNVKSAHGNVTLAQLASACKITNSHGDTNATELGNVDLNASHGKVVFKKTGPLKVKARHADIEFATVAGAATIDAKHGKIKISQVSGLLNIESGHGKVHAENIQQAKMKLSHSDAKIVHVKTTAEIKGSHSDITVALSPNANPAVSAKASYGDVNNTFRKSAGNQPALNLNTSHGDINVIHSKTAPSSDLPAEAPDVAA